jgi:stage II sporulation protein M
MDLVGLCLLYQHIKHMRKYIGVATAIFALGIVLGCTHQYADIMRATVDGMADLGKAAEHWPNYHLGLFTLLLLNNVSALASVLFGGAILGIVPIYFLIMNGMAIGYSGVQEAAGGFPLPYVMQILPSGIFEWPAMILASAYGIRFGFLLLDGLLSLPSETGRARVKNSFVQYVRVLIPLMGVVFLLLLVGSLLETFLAS